MTASQSWPGGPTIRGSDSPKRPDYPDKIRAHLGGVGTGFTYEVDLFPYGRDNCPECGKPLAQFNRESHAVEHYGYDEPTPVKEHYLARVRRAVILSLPIPEA